MAELLEFRITFRAEDVAQAAFPAAHELGYVTVLAPDETAARNLIFARVGEAWGLIDEAPFDDPWSDFPLGELDRWTTTAPTQVGS